MTNLKKLSILALTVLFLAAAGCKKDKMDPDVDGMPDPDPKTFTVEMTDSPGDYEALHVEILKVEAFLQGEGWITLQSKSRTYNVLDLTNGKTIKIANMTSAEAHYGTYTMVKVTFGDNNKLQLNHAAAFDLGPVAIDANGLVDLTIQREKELIIAIDEEVNANSGAYVLLDFNVAQSVWKDVDHYVFDPVMTEVKDAQTGVKGEVTGAATAVVILSDDANSYSTYINAQGQFLIRGVKDGVYTLTCMPGQHAEEAPQPYQLQGLVVTQGEITTVGTIAF